VSGRRILVDEDVLVEVIRREVGLLVDQMEHNFELRLAKETARLDQMLAGLRRLERKREAYGVERRDHAAQN
jgi:hypothetical protein